jgi:hypothetical protein
LPGRRCFHRQNFFSFHKASPNSSVLTG